MALDRPRYDRSRRRFGVTGRPHRFPAAAVLVVVVVVVVVVELSPRYPEPAVDPGRVGIRG
ncbi:MAG: hypothetical protein Q7T31_08095 [Dietzia sp.]|uniref:hypothetical protein n=1 Tax=Dietzia sp. TaxID=1871616 RepID=UPI0027194086|nr:hypothetical protein [Dietzia sp.]MDO8394332.1 hypothetical protein [Dietzia sp.]